MDTFPIKAMKKALRALFHGVATLCAVALGRVACKGLSSGLPDAMGGASNAAVVPSGTEIAGVVTKVSDGDTIRVTDAHGVQHDVRDIAGIMTEVGKDFLSLPFRLLGGL